MQVNGIKHVGPSFTNFWMNILKVITTGKPNHIGNHLLKKGIALTLLFP